MKILYVKDFGAVGDGVTDDAKAIHRAVQAVIDAKENVCLQFEPNTTYYYKDNGTDVKAVFFLHNVKNVTVRGYNTTIELGGYDLYYADFEFTDGLTIEGFNFDYREYKPGFRADFESIDFETNTAIMIADRDLQLKNGEIYDHTQQRYELFACVDCPTGRHHMYVLRYEMLDAEARRFKVVFNDDERTLRRLRMDYVREGLIMMFPYSGNNIERAFSVHQNNDFTIRNVNVYSSSRHVFSLQYNTGEFYFDNVNFVRSPKDYNVRFNSWGDTLHLLQNRAHYVWNNCTIEWNYDDVFNISVSALVPHKVFAPNEVDLFFLEEDGEISFPQMYKGDRVTVVNYRTSQVVRTTIEEVILQEGATNHVRFAQDIPWLEASEEIMVYVDELVGPQMLMRDCHFDGTFRARANLTFENCYFYNRRFWVGNEVWVEGPLPHDIIFKNCQFEHDDDKDVYWHIHSWGGHSENIVFENCTGVSLSQFERHPDDDIIIR